MNVIIVNKFWYPKGGAEQYALLVAHELERRGDRVIPFAMKHSKNIPSPFENLFPSEVETERVRISWKAFMGIGRMLYSIQARRNMARLIELTHPDLAHIHNIYAQLSPSILHALRDRRIPVVMTVHDQHLLSPQYNLPVSGAGEDVSKYGVARATLSRFHKNSFLASFLQTFTFRFHRRLRIYERYVDLFLCPSEYLRRRMIANGFPKERVRHLPYGIDPEAFTPREDHEEYFLFVGRLSEEKGADFILKLAAALPDLPFKIVGTGPDEEKLHLRGDKLPNVSFEGFKSGKDLVKLYQGARAVLVPSRVEENFPLTILEAMAYAKPVVASKAGGIPELLEDRITGYLASPTDIRSWIEALLRIAYDEPARLQMARAARLSAETTFHIKHHWQGLFSAYEEAIRMKGERSW